MNEWIVHPASLLAPPDAAGRLRNHKEHTNDQLTLAMSCSRLGIKLL